MALLRSPPFPSVAGRNLVVGKSKPPVKLKTSCSYQSTKVTSLDSLFKLLKIQTCCLQVSIHCDGCKQKVKKILLKIEGVYKVHIEAEQQKVTVLGSVDSATLIKKLVRAGKHAVLWSQKGNQSQQQKINCIKDDKNGKAQKQGSIKGLEAFKAQPKFPIFNFEEDEDEDDMDDEEDDEEEELRYLREKASQLSLMRQQAIDAANNAKRGIVASSNNGKINNYAGNVNAQKKANPNQNAGVVKGGSNNPGGIDQKTMAALKMSNPHLVGVGNINSAEGKRGNDVNSMMGRGGFLGNGGNIAPAAATALGGNSNGGSVGFQIQQPNGFQGSPSAGLFPNGGFAGTGHQHLHQQQQQQQQHPSPMLMNLNGSQYNNQHPSQMMMNMNMMNMQQNRHAVQQPQMMYNRSPFIPTSTGYYYNYSPAAPSPPPSHYYTHYDPDDSASHIFNDENTSSCSIM